MQKQVIDLDSVANTLFEYLRDVFYDPTKASLDVEALPESYQDLGNGLVFFADCVMETKRVAYALSQGDLDIPLPSRDNEIAAPLKSLHASLKHLSWQTKQIALGDYSQRVDFMGEFSESFNSMVEKLAERQHFLEEKANKDSFTKIYNRAFAMNTLERYLSQKMRFVLVFADLDGR